MQEQKDHFFSLSLNYIDQWVKQWEIPRFQRPF